MARHNNLGLWGEHFAQQMLEVLGYRILETNWRYGRVEVDIIAMDQNQLCIIEVKTRSNLSFGEPEAFVDRRKMNRLMDAGVAYAHQQGHNGEIRFDIIGVSKGKSGKTTLNHVKDAFFPEIGW